MQAYAFFFAKMLHIQIFCCTFAPDFGSILREPPRKSNEVVKLQDENLTRTASEAIVRVKSVEQSGVL